MTIPILLLNITCVSFFLLAFIAFINPLKVNVIANRWFGVFLFAAGSAVLDLIIYQANAMADYRRLVSFNELSRFAMMPALYLSVLHYTSANKTVRRAEYLHFIPFAIFFLCTASFVVKPYQMLFKADAFPAVFRIVLEIFIKLAIPAQLIVYWLLSYNKLHQHTKNIQMVTSNTGPVNLKWLRLLLIGVLLMIVVSIFARLFSDENLRAYAPLGYLIGTLFVAYFLLAQKEIYPYEEPELESINTIINPEKRTTRQRLPEETLALLKARVIALIETERLFLDNELGLPDLAGQMGVSPHDLSYLLNEGFGLNFFQFINSYRVAEAKQLMLSDKYRHLNILGIAYSAGFNSKTTFNTAFKKETGMSPSQFIQQAQTSVALETVG